MTQLGFYYDEDADALLLDLHKGLVRVYFKYEHPLVCVDDTELEENDSRLDCFRVAVGTFPDFVNYTLRQILEAAENQYESIVGGYRLEESYEQDTIDEISSINRTGRI